MKRRVATFGLLVSVVGLAMVSSVPAQAQGESAVFFHRVCTIAPGQGDAAVDFARRVADYIDSKYPELQIATSRPSLNPVNQIHWVTQHESMETYGAFQPVLAQDQTYGNLVQTAQGLFVLDSCVDTLFNNLR